MPRSDFRTPRLFLNGPLSNGGRLEADRSQAHYLLNVLRLGEDDEILVFNGRDGEWRARITDVGRRACALSLRIRTRLQCPLSDLHYFFAPLKVGRLDYMVQKAVEVGVGALRPILTEYTQVRRLNVERVEANVIEACEQCGVIAVPRVEDPLPLDLLIEQWLHAEGARRLLYCDEAADERNPLAVLRHARPGPLAVLVGPEGGFSPRERSFLRAQPFVSPLPLGPRILRADTAAVAALAIVQATLGDWR